MPLPVPLQQPGALAEPQVYQLPPVMPDTYTLGQGCPHKDGQISVLLGHAGPGGSPEAVLPRRRDHAERHP